jgi:hypothetical protein
MANAAVITEIVGRSTGLGWSLLNSCSRVRLWLSG